ncbi:Isochorismatase hydrolase [Sphaerulina musiva SO2202]|uniref:Isochorismatase hydrolase n=1 Tax=Sphaerulina musiva (strain SO2202) TaxID=692275 RepID=N1QI17_SPHMS|nr:Isochorismatase hydrolase [Sphaerulina musiva SO2202]EMF10803.1 Isochorismatase hydrolase [Sphaerulina musiva SO2202]
MTLLTLTLLFFHSVGFVAGNYYNFWNVDAASSTWDLTRSARMAVTSPKTIPMLGMRKTAIIEPNRTAYIIVDMQNFFLHPQLSPNATRGRLAVGPTLDMIHAFRKNAMKILWVNWGIDAYDLLTMPPAFLDTFATDHTAATSFCSDMGVLQDGGMEIAMGGKLCRGSWNARPYGPLYKEMVKGIEHGTDVLLHKNRFSGLWGAQTPLGLYLQETGITTLFISGVNSDQCVWSTLIDAFFKGFDIVYVEDCTATTSPWYAEEMARYNADFNGFLANSTVVPWVPIYECVSQMWTSGFVLKLQATERALQQ